MITNALNSSRKTLAAWIWEELADIEFSSLYAPFGGDCRVPQFFKRKGYQTFVSDILQSHYWRGVALVQNNENILTPNHYQAIVETTGLFNDFSAWQDHYFTREETQCLGLWWNNIENNADFQSSPELKGMAYNAVYLTMAYWLNFNQSYLQAKALSPDEVMKHYVQQLNSWVVDNQMPNMAYFIDAYQLADQLPADVLWVNPPGMSGFRDTNLKTELSECWTRRVPQINLAGVINETGNPKLGQSYQDSGSYLEALSQFLDLCQGSRIWVLQHGEHLGVDLESFEAMVESKRQIWKRASMSIPYPYADETLVSKETLLIAVGE